MARLACALALVAAGCSSSPTTARRPPTSTTTTVPPVTATTVPNPVEVPSVRAAAPPPPPAGPIPPAEVGAAPSVNEIHANLNVGGPDASTLSGPARASWYARGARTASGEAFDPDGLTYAHLSDAFGTTTRFCHAGRCVVARANDRGPAAWTGRTFDLSRGAFAAISPLSAGVIDVTWGPA